MGEGEVSEFVHYLRFEKKYSPRTQESYECDLRQFFQYAELNYPDTPIANITHFHLRSWLAELKEAGNAARTINRKMSALSGLFVYLRKNGSCSHNPVKKLHSMRLPERLPTSLRESETKNLFAHATFADDFEGLTERLVCELLYATGMRRSELTALPETNIEWGRSCIRILGKGSKERQVFVSAALLDTLRDYIAQKRVLFGNTHPYVFSLKSGAPLYPQFVNRLVKKHLEPVTTLHKKSPHVLRHTFATHLLNNGAEMQAIKELLGHSSLASTQVYTHNNIARLKEIHKTNHPRG